MTTSWVETDDGDSEQQNSNGDGGKKKRDVQGENQKNDSKSEFVERE